MWSSVIPILNWFATAIGAATMGSWFVSQDAATQQNPEQRVTFMNWLSRRSMTMKVIIFLSFGLLIYFLYKKVRR